MPTAVDAVGGFTSCRFCSRAQSPSVSLIPSFESTLEKLLLFFGVPTLLVIAIISVLDLIGWVERILSTRRAAGRVTRSLVEVLGLTGKRPPMEIPLTVAAQGALVLATYAIVQLGQTIVALGLDDGREYSTGAVLQEAIRA